MARGRRVFSFFRKCHSGKYGRRGKCPPKGLRMSPVVQGQIDTPGVWTLFLQRFLGLEKRGFFVSGQTEQHGPRSLFFGPDPPNTNFLTFPEILTSNHRFRRHFLPRHNFSPKCLGTLIYPPNPPQTLPDPTPDPPQTLPDPPRPSQIPKNPPQTPNIADLGPNVVVLPRCPGPLFLVQKTPSGPLFCLYMCLKHLLEPLLPSRPSRPLYLT